MITNDQRVEWRYAGVIAWHVRGSSHEWTWMRRNLHQRIVEAHASDSRKRIEMGEMEAVLERMNSIIEGAVSRAWCASQSDS